MKKSHSYCLSLSLFSLYLVSGQVAAEGRSLEAGSLKDNNEVVLEEIIVTGEQIARKANESSSGLDVFSNKQLQQKPGINSLTQLLKQGTNILDMGIGNELPTIRGIEGSATPGALSAFTGAMPRINMQIDGRSLNYNEAAFMTKSLWDMKQVEVYRGPLSYAQGRNSIAGAVIMKSNDPTNEFESAIKLGAGNQKQRQYAAMVSGPIIKDELAFRLSVDHQGRKSYEKDVVSYKPAGDPTKIESTTARAKLLWSPSAIPDLYSRLSFNYTKSRNPQGEFKVTSPMYEHRSVFELHNSTTSWDIGYNLTDELVLENSVSYSKYKQDRFAIPSQGPANFDGREIQVKPTITFDNGSTKGKFGLYYLNSSQDDNVLFVAPTHYKDNITNKAIFGEVTFKPYSAIELNLAGRYEQVKHKRIGGPTFTSLPNPNHIPQITMMNMLLNSLPLNYNKKEHVFLYKFDIAYLMSDNHRIGAKIARGYNSGGAGTSLKGSYEYKPEYVTNYELYHRWQSEDNALSLNTNIFYNDYKDMQIPYIELGNPLPMISNANKVKTYGIEFGLNYQPSENLNLYSKLGLLKTKVKEYTDNEIFGGNKLGNAPKYTMNIGGSYTFPLGLEIGGDVNFVGDYYASPKNSIKIKSYTQANMYMAYHFNKDGKVTLYCNNLFDSHKPIKVIEHNKNALTTYQRPRELGVSLNYNF